MDRPDRTDELRFVAEMMTNYVGLKADVGEKVYHVEDRQDDAGDAVHRRGQQPCEAHCAYDSDEIGEDGA